MEKFLFIVRSCTGEEIHSQEINPPGTLISTAHALMDVVRGEYRNVDVECCEIWCRTARCEMVLLGTAF